MSTPGSMRDAMPETAAFIDAMRAEFGADAVDPSIRAGMRGGFGFHAKEAGQEIGTPLPLRQYVELVSPDRWQRKEAGR